MHLPCAFRRVLVASLAALCLFDFRPSTASAASSVEKLQEFPLDQVQVTDTYYQNLFSKERKEMPASPSSFPSKA